MSVLERLKLEESALQLRDIARQLVKLSPAAAVKVSAIATEVELRVKQLEALR